MANQVIPCPAALLQELRNGFVSTAARPGHPVITLEPLTNGARCVGLMVSVDDLWLTWDHWPAYGSQVFVLQLTCVPLEGTFAPRPLPGQMVTRTMDALAVQASAWLSGHDWVELADLLDNAKTAPNSVPLIPMTRAPRSRFERKLVAGALDLHRRWSPMLQPLQESIAAYGSSLLQSGVGPLVESLSTEAGVADHLNLSPGNGPRVWRVALDDPAHYESLAKEIDKARRMRGTTWWISSALCPYSAAPRSRPSYHVRELYRCGFAHSGTDYDAPLWRPEGFKGCEFPVRVPAVGIEAALSRFAAAFDRRLLAGIDPIVRAGLAMFHLLRIQPVGRRDRDAALLLFYILLRETGLPPLPVLLVMHDRYWELANMMVGALERDRPDGLVEAMIDVVTAAQAIGGVMADRLSRARQALADALAKGGVATEDAGTTASTLLSVPLIRIWGSPNLVPPGDADLTAQAGYLHQAGLIDLIEVGRRRWWSSPEARTLASRKAS